MIIHIPKWLPAFPLFNRHESLVQYTLYDRLYFSFQTERGRNSPIWWEISGQAPPYANIPVKIEDGIANEKGAAEAF
jgi:hypothetical protein